MRQNVSKKSKIERCGALPQLHRKNIPLVWLRLLHIARSSTRALDRLSVMLHHGRSDMTRTEWPMPLMRSLVGKCILLIFAQLGDITKAVRITSDECSTSEEIRMLRHIVCFGEQPSICSSLLRRNALCVAKRSVSMRQTVQSQGSGTTHS